MWRETACEILKSLCQTCKGLVVTISSSNLGHQCHWHVAGDENDRARVIMIEMLQGLTYVVTGATTKTGNGDHHVGTFGLEEDIRTLYILYACGFSQLQACFVYWGVNYYASLHNPFVSGKKTQPKRRRLYSAYFFPKWVLSATQVPFLICGRVELLLETDRTVTRPPPTAAADLPTRPPLTRGQRATPAQLPPSHTTIAGALLPHY